MIPRSDVVFIRLYVRRESSTANGMAPLIDSTSLALNAASMDVVLDAVSEYDRVRSSWGRLGNISVAKY
jgi:hypothetical protein